MSVRETWASRPGFIAAAIGSAVGLGNIWRFPYEAASNGGAAFLVVNFVLILLVGLPAMLVEFTIGRRAHRNIVDAYGRGGRIWKLAGVFGMITGFWILAYYTVVAGWVTRYMVGSLSGAYFSDPEAYFSAVSSGMDALFFHGLFTLLAVGVVALGIKRGIELATKIMVPAIVVLMVALAAYAATLPGAGEGYQFFLTPDLNTIIANIGTIGPAALGEVLFTLSLGMGAMITYASYVDSDQNLAADGIIIVLANTAIGYLAGLIVFPLLFSQGVDPGEAGAGAIFISVAKAFKTLPAGQLLGVVFYFIVFIAALSSAISLLEVVVSYFVDNYDASRPVVATAVGLGTFLLGIPAAFGVSTLELYDKIAGQLLLPIGIFLATIFVGWVYGRDAITELGRGAGDRLAHLWHWHVRYVVLLAVLVTLAVSVSSFTGISPLVIAAAAAVVILAIIGARAYRGSTPA